MDFFSLIKTRRSIRSFQEKEIDKKTIKMMIEMATYAPSACNIQGWRFIVVDDQTKKQQIIDRGGSVNIKKALGILVLYDNRTKNTEYADHIQSAAAAIQNLLLTAHFLGLGACWTCHLPPKNQLRKIFKIPRTLSPIAYVIVGYKKKEPITVPRKHTLNEIIDFNTFSSKRTPEKTSRPKLFLKKILIKIYWLIPVSIKSKWLNQYLDKKFVKKFEN